MGDEDIVWDDAPQASSDTDIQWDDAPVATGDVESPSFGKIASKALGDSALGQGARVAGAMTGMGRPLPQQKGTSFLDPAIRAAGVPFGISYNTPVPTPAQIAETNPNLGAMAQTGQDMFMPAFNYYNEMMLNAPKAMMQNMGYQPPESSSPLTSMLNAGAGMAGMARNPILAGANPVQKLPELMMRGAAFGAARTPDEGGLLNPASRAMQAGLGAAIPAGMHVAMSALKNSPAVLQKLANLIMRSQVPARGRDVNRALGTNVPQFLSTEGVTGSNLDEMLSKVQPIIDQTSQQVRQALGQSGKTTDVTPLLRRLQDYANRLAKDPNTNKAEINSVRNLAVDLTNRVRRVGGNASRVPVSEAWEMKMLIDAQKANSSWGSQSQSTYNALMGQLHFDAKNALTKAVPEAEALMSRQSNAIQARRSIEKQLENLDKSHGAFSIAAAGIRHSPALYGAKLMYDGMTQDDYKKVAEGAALIGGDAIISNPKIATNLAKSFSSASREMQAFMTNKYPKLVQGMWRAVAKLQQGGAGKNPTMGQTPPPSAPPSGGGGSTPPPSAPRGPQGPKGLPQPPNFHTTAVGEVPAVRGPRSMQQGDWMPALPKGEPQLTGPEGRKMLEKQFESRPAPRQLESQNFNMLTGDEKRSAIIKSRAAKMNRKKAPNTLIGQREFEKGNRSVGAAATSSLEASPAVMAPPRNAEGLAPKSSEYTSVMRETAPENEKILQDIDWGTMKSRNPLIERLQEFKDDGTPLGKHLNEQAKTLIKSIYQGEQDAGATAREFIQSNAGVLDQKAGTHMSRGVAARSSEAPLSESKTIREGNPSATNVGDKSVGAMEVADKEGRFMRGGKTKSKPVEEFFKGVDIPIMPNDGVANIDEAIKKGSGIQRLRPTVLDKRQSLRYGVNEQGLRGNEKMAFPNESYPKGRDTFDSFGCGRGEFCKLNELEKGACYMPEGGKPACYAAQLGSMKGRDVATGEYYKGLKKGSDAYVAMFKDFKELLSKNKESLENAPKSLEFMKSVYPDHKIAYYPKENNFSIAVKQPPHGAQIFSKLQNAKGVDLRLGVDTDGSAWLSPVDAEGKPTNILNSIMRAEPRTVSCYSSAYYPPPPPHPLAGRTTINVTISGWHPLPETVGRLNWAKEARDNGWNVILRVVTANPKQFPAEAARFNRIIPAIEKSDFYYMEQPLHVGTKHAEPMMDGGKVPSCCKGSGTNPATCHQCRVSEGLGTYFKEYWSKRGGGSIDKDAKILPDIPDFRKQQAKFKEKS